MGDRCSGKTVVGFGVRDNDALGLRQFGPLGPPKLLDASLAAGRGNVSRGSS